MLRDLSVLRDELNDIDKEILSLFEKRMNIATEVIKYKVENKKPIYDPEREKQVIENRVSLLQNPKFAPYAVTLFESLMDMSKAEQQAYLSTLKDSGEDVKKACAPRALPYEKGMVVAHQGVPGAYSEEALFSFFGSETSTLSCPQFEDVFRAITEKRAVYGVLPVENSTTGTVAEVYDLLAKYGLFIVGEQYLHIEHYLLGLKGSTLSDIKEVYSHKQGLLQCAPYLKEHGFTPCEHSNTAKAASFVASNGDASKAAIASKAAGEKYGLQVLAYPISTKQDNYTRFIIVSNTPLESPASDKVSLAFTLSHESGSLYKALSHFSKRALNLTRIESRPIRDKNWEYLFYVDFEGNAGAKDVMDALSELSREAMDVKMFGNYPAKKLSGM